MKFYSHFPLVFSTHQMTNTADKIKTLPWPEFSQPRYGIQAQIRGGGGGGFGCAECD